jgi:hypothetical protein
MRTIQFAALVLTALTLIASGAHLFALPNKIAMSRDHYFIAQSIYRGWALLGAVLVGTLVVNLLMAYATRDRTGAMALALLSAALIAANLAIFFIWTFPANQATQNWTAAPSDWEALRRQWEYSHAVNAFITFAAFCSTALSVLAARRS